MFDEATRLPALQLTTALRQAGVSVTVYPRAEKLQKQLKYADRIAAPLVIIYGPDEQRQQIVTVKDLRKHMQHQVEREDLIPFIQRYLRDQHEHRL